MSVSKLGLAVVVHGRSVGASTAYHAAVGPPPVYKGFSDDHEKMQIAGQHGNKVRRKILIEAAYSAGKELQNRATVESCATI